jgi:hypothetical protein
MKRERLYPFLLRESVLLGTHTAVSEGVIFFFYYFLLLFLFLIGVDS